MSGGSSNRLLNSVIEGGMSFGSGTHHNLIEGNDFKPPPCATNVIDFPIGALSHHNQFRNNTVIRDEGAAPYSCTCAGISRNVKCSGSRFFHLDQGTADNEFIGNDIQLLYADNYNGGSPDAEITVGNYGAVRNIWRNNNMRMKLIPGRAEGYAFYLRDGSNDNLLENNTIEVENGAHAMAFVSGAMPDTVTRNMIRANRFYANGETLYQQNMGPVNYLVGNIIASFNGRAVTDLGLEGRTQVFVHNTIYAQNGWGLQGEGGNSSRIVRFKHNIVYTTNNIGIGVGPVAFDAT